MNDFNIRITRREGDIEQSIDIDCSSPLINGFPAVIPDRSVAQASAPATSRLEWSPTLCNGERVNYAAAEKACAALGPGWRLPTRFELESILDLSRFDPAIDTARFPDTKSGSYWSSTSYAANSDYAWFVNFDSGSVNGAFRDGNFAFVRACRPSQ